MTKESTLSAAQLLKLQQLSKKGFAVYEYQGVSMSPFFRQGDQITVQSYQDNAPRIGDVVVFSRNNQLVLHRLIQIKIDDIRNTKIFVTKGDNCRQADKPMRRTEILGRALIIHRNKSDIRLDSTRAYFVQKLIATLSLGELRAVGSLKRIKSLLKGK